MSKMMLFLLLAGLVVIPTADAGHGCPNDWKCAQYCHRLACNAGYCKWWVVCTCSRCRGGRRSVENEVELAELEDN